MGTPDSCKIFEGCASSGSVAVGAQTRSSHVDSPPESSEPMSLASDYTQCPFCSSELKTRNAYEKHVERHKRVQKLKGNKHVLITSQTLA